MERLQSLSLQRPRVEAWQIYGWGKTRALGMARLILGRTSPGTSTEQRDFERFADICERMARGEHRLRSGLVEIVRLAGEMNPSGKRGYPSDLIIRSLTKMKA